jgi:hypothetical protein
MSEDKDSPFPYFSFGSVVRRILFTELSYFFGAEGGGYKHRKRKSIAFFHKRFHLEENISVRIFYLFTQIYVIV